METKTSTCEYCDETDRYRLGTLTVTDDGGETFWDIYVCDEHLGLYL